MQTEAAEFSPLYSPDGKWIAYVASDNPPTWGGDGTRARHPGRRAARRGSWPRPSTASAATPSWSAGRPTASGSTSPRPAAPALRLNALPLERRRPRNSARPTASSAAASSSTPRARTFGFGWETLDKPPEAYVSPVERFEPAAVSQRQRRPARRCRWAGPRSIRWKSPDGLEIEGLLTYPVGYEKGKRYPLLLVIHGGPTGVFTQTFIGTPGLYPVAAFAARGYAVLRPNPRGSSGYGKKFRYANYGDWGGGDYQGPDGRRRSRHRAWASPTPTAWASWAGATAAS